MTQPPAANEALTHGFLLNGRIRYAQPRSGFRSGIEPVLLAASIPARPGQRVIEAGTGAGAALLCLAARVPGIIGVGVERDPAMADLARANAADNGFNALTFLTDDIAARSAPGLFDHAFTACHAAHGEAGAGRAVRNLGRKSGRGAKATWHTHSDRTCRGRAGLPVRLTGCEMPRHAAGAALAEAGPRCQTGPAARCQGRTQPATAASWPDPSYGNQRFHPSGGSHPSGWCRAIGITKPEDTSARTVRSHRPPGQHQFEYAEQLLRDLEISLIARVMKRDQYLVG